MKLQNNHLLLGNIVDYHSNKDIFLNDPIIIPNRDIGRDIIWIIENLKCRCAFVAEETEVNIDPDNHKIQRIYGDILVYFEELTDAMAYKLWLDNS